MPPEPLPFDRKDFFKERKHERSAASEFSSSSSLGSGPGRWRELSSSASLGYHNNNNGRDFARWGSPNDFRSRPPGHGKQGGWHLFEESGHGYAPPRSGEKMWGDDNLLARGDGQYGRNSKENKGSFNQRDWKGHSWDMSNGSSHMPGRENDVSKDQKSADDSLMNVPSNCPQSNFVNTRDQLPSKDHNDNGRTVNANGLGLWQRDNSLEWKPLNKWARSGSLSSRGSGFSHSSSSKSLGGVDSNDGKTELQQTNVASVLSPSGDAVPCVTSVVPSEETTSRKKPRLGWGEGLAKYEKKKVEGPDLSGNKDGAIISCINGEPNNSQCSNLAERSPRVMGFSDCASPATPSSVACSSSPGVEEKTSSKAVNIDNDVTNLCGSPSIGSHDHPEGISFNLEKLDVSSLVNLSCSLTSMLQFDDLSSVDSGFVRTTDLSKLLVLKGEISKDLETTESEIDSLENELKSLKFNLGTGSHCPTASRPLLAEGSAKPLNDPPPSPLQVVSCDKDIVATIPSSHGSSHEVHGNVKDDDVDSPGTATSKFVELESFAGAASLSDMVKEHEHFGDLDAVVPTGMTQKCLEAHPDGGETAIEVHKDCSEQTESKNGVPGSDAAISPPDEDNLCNLIWASNKESASRAVEVFNKLLQVNQCQIDFSGFLMASSQQPDELIKEKFSARKRFLRFRERVVTFKFKAYQQVWKEDMHILSMRKFRAKSQKKCELSSLTALSVLLKHRSSNRSRLTSPAGIFGLVPTTDMFNFMSKLSDSQVQPYRNALKMPALILDAKEKMSSRFISSNGLVEDPCAVERERALVNPWTLEERDIFIDKLASFGKDFRRIASFLDHKTTADCVEFYYKNHKSSSFEKIKKKQVKTNADYLMGAGKRWNHEVCAASLDVLGAASVIAADADNASRNRQTYAGRIFLGGCTSSKASHGDDDISKGRNIEFGSERETVAADVLAGICGSLSSEAMSSCVTTSVDLGGGYWEPKCQQVNAVVKRFSTSETTQNVDEDMCSDESCGELDPSDWTDEEKSIFMEAVSSYGKDFAMISRRVKTRSVDQCKVFFSKARKCLGLDQIHPGPGTLGTPVSDDANGGGSDTEYTSALETGLAICSGKSGSKMDQDLQLPVADTKQDQSGLLGRMNLPADLNGPAETSGTGMLDEEASVVVEASVPVACPSEQRSELVCDGEQNIMTDIIQQAEPSRFLLEPVNVEAGSNQVPEDGVCVNFQKEDGVCVAESTSVEKSCRNRDVKLFGQILCNASSMQNGNSDNDFVDEEKEAHHSQPSNTPPKFTSHCGIDGNVSRPKFDHPNHLMVESKSLTSIWGGTKMQTGYPSLADAAILQSKYPVLSNHHASLSKMEHQSLQPVVGSNNINLNGIPAFHPREMSNSNGLVECQTYRSHESTKVLHPFTIDIKQHPDERQRRNGFEVNPQQQGLGLAGINIVGRGGILLGAPCTGVTDTAMVAIRRLKAKTDQYGGQNGNVFRDEGSWRGKGDIGR